MGRTAFAVAAHPDDIEFMMAGTLLLLGEAGYELHYLNIANGSCGSMTMGRDETVSVRAGEALAAAAALGATWHEPLVDDIQVHYTPALAARLGAIVRHVDPTILLLPSPQDYMEDHMNASRLAVTAAFCRNMPNFPTDPPTPHVATEMAVYHAMPHGLRGPLGEPIRPDFIVDVSAMMDRKKRALACHQSQKRWLDQSQGIDSYLKTMEEMTAAIGRRSGRFAYGEGWRRRLHFGFGGEAFDPLGEALGTRVATTA